MREIWSAQCQGIEILFTPVFHIKNSSKESTTILSLSAMVLKRQERDLKVKTSKRKGKWKSLKKGLALTIADLATAR